MVFSCNASIHDEGVHERILRHGIPGVYAILLDDYICVCRGGRVFHNSAVSGEVHNVLRDYGRDAHVARGHGVFYDGDNPGNPMPVLAGGLLLFQLHRQKQWSQALQCCALL